MAKAVKVASKSGKPPKKRPGIHSKSQSSKIKHSKSYKKRNVGQGK
jgi:hypothetical protein